MEINSQVEYLKQFLNAEQLDLLDRMYPTKEYTARTLNQIEKTIKHKDNTIKQLLLKIEQLENGDL